MEKITARAALENARKNDYSKWKSPETGAAERLTRRVCVPWYEPSFSITPEQKIFTIGSCFARNVEERLALHHSGVLSMNVEIPGAAIGTGRKSGIVNKYNVLSMMQEFAWASGEQAYPDDAFLPTKDGLLYDPHIRRAIDDAPLDVMQQRRASLDEYFKRALNSDLIVVTLGLAEVWMDERTGLACNEIPDLFNLRRDAERFSFGFLSVDDNIKALEQIYGILQRHGKPGFKMLVTTSPVPLGRTFTSEDVIIANMHAKSTLRIAALEFALAHEHVDYYPSYEAAMVSDRRIVWCEDQLHVSDYMVGQIISTFLKRYGIDIALEDLPVDEGGDDALIAQLRREIDRLQQKMRVADRVKAAE